MALERCIASQYIFSKSWHHPVITHCALTMIHPRITTRTCSWIQFTRLYYLNLSTWSHATQEWFLHSNLLSPWSYPIKAQTLEHTKRQFHDASVLVVPSNFYVNWCHWARFPVQLPKALSKNRCRNERLRQCRGNNEEGYGRHGRERVLGLGTIVIWLWSLGPQRLDLWTCMWALRRYSQTPKFA